MKILTCVVIVSLFCMFLGSDIDSIIEKCIDDIWKTYDKDNSGFLDKGETIAFVKNTLTEMGESGEFSEADFEACFKEFDKDGNGTISKDEMKIFIKKVAGLRLLESISSNINTNSLIKIVQQSLAENIHVNLGIEKQ